MLEFALQGAQRQGRLALAEQYHHDRRAVGLGAAEQRVAKPAEQAVFQPAVVLRCGWSGGHGGCGGGVPDAQQTTRG